MRILSESASERANERFEEIMGELHELIEEAFELSGRDRSAEGYWYNTMKGCIDGRATMINMEQTLEEMGGSENEDMMELGYNDGIEGNDMKYPDDPFYAANYEDGATRRNEG